MFFREFDPLEKIIELQKKLEKSKIDLVEIIGTDHDWSQPPEELLELVNKLLAEIDEAKKSMSMYKEWVKGTQRAVDALAYLISMK